MYAMRLLSDIDLSKTLSLQGRLAADGKAEISYCLDSPTTSLLLGHHCSRFQHSAIHAEFLCVLGVI